MFAFLKRLNFFPWLAGLFRRPKPETAMSAINPTQLPLATPAVAAAPAPTPVPVSPQPQAADIAPAVAGVTDQPAAVPVLPLKRDLEAIKADIETQIEALAALAAQRTGLDAAETSAKSLMSSLKDEFETALSEFKARF